jgi:hypothetical protein
VAKTPPSLTALRTPLEGLHHLPPPPPERPQTVPAFVQRAERQAALADDIASALAELSPEAPAPLVAPPPPQPEPEPEPEAPVLETPTGLRSLAQRIKTVATMEVPLPFVKSTSAGTTGTTGQFKAVSAPPKPQPPNATGKGDARRTHQGSLPPKVR